ncbi:MAG: Peptidoglycan-binding domain 1 protein [Nocardioidaceae bacterium]|nr:Peptidoglycan-binding domain 1 protein [Nocardioidaceae bacterium]
MKKSTSRMLVVLLLLGTAGLAWCVGEAVGALQPARTSTPRAALVGVEAPLVAEPAPVPVTSLPEVRAASLAAATVGDTPKPKPPGLVRVLGPGDHGDAVRDLQARLRELSWFSGRITGHYQRSTTNAVRGFQKKRHLKAKGVVDVRTLRVLTRMTDTPSEAEKHNKVGSSASTDARLDKRCKDGHVICIDKTSQTLRWVVDGEVLGTMDVRFGALYTPTRDGLFHVTRKDADHVSTLFHSAMPYSMFFSGGQAVHYSSDFAARGYAGASHGCVNVRDYAGVKWLFGQVDVGDGVVVYRS